MMWSLSEDFRPVELKDVDIILTYLDRAQYEESNHNVVNLFLWQRYFPLWIYTHPDYVLLIGIHKGVLFSYMPLCEAHHLEAALIKAKSLFDAYGMPFELSCFVEAQKEAFLKLYPSYHAIHEPASSDYIYEADKLRSLSGKKLQKRRNNYNNFLTTFENRWTYEALSHANLDDVKAFLKTWEPELGSEYALHEWLGCFSILDLFGQLPYVGGVIRIDGEVKAFVIGSYASKRMAQLNIEKADPTIRGLYQAIEKTFLEHNFLDVSYINREDDMGLEALRRSKLALMPCCMIEKYRLKPQ